MTANVLGGVIVVLVGIGILLWGSFFLASTLASLSNLSYICQTPQSGFYEGNPNACYYQMTTATVIGGVLFAAGLLIVRSGWREFSPPSNPATRNEQSASAFTNDRHYGPTRRKISI